MSDDRPLYRVLRFMAGHIRSAYGAILTYLSFSFFVGLGALWAFGAMADEVLEGETQTFDDAVLNWVDAHRDGTLDGIALEITALGNFATLAVLVLTVSVFLWLTRHRFSMALLMIAVAGGGLLNTLLKDVFDRPRPTVIEWGTDVVTHSFPSGHSMAAAIAYGSVAYLCGRLGPSLKLRLTTWIGAAILVLAIGASRIYLGVHYPSDVVAGYIAGLAWTAFVISGLTAVRYLARHNPEIAEHEEDLQLEEDRESRLAP